MNGKPKWKLALFLGLMVLLAAAIGACASMEQATPTATTPATAPGVTTIAVTPTRTTAPTAITIAATPTPTPRAILTVTVTAKKIPHTLEGHADCLMCHQTGINGAKKVPLDHAGRTNETCLGCHKPATP